MSTQEIISKLAQMSRRRAVEWIHPSYRDLVVEQLASDETLRQRFLKVMNLEGLKLAVSQSGGARGQRRLPLLITEQDWAALLTKCIGLLGSFTTNEAIALIRVLRSATVDLTGNDKARLLAVLSACCQKITENVDSAKQAMKEAELRELMDATVLIDPLPVLPQLGPTWRAATSALSTDLQESNEHSSLINAGVVMEWARLSDLLTKNEPRFMRQANFPEALTGEITQLLVTIRKECGPTTEYEDPQEMLSEANRLDMLEKALRIIGDLFPSLKDETSEVRSLVSSQEDNLRDQYRDAQQGPEDEEYEDDEVREIPSGHAFDLDSLFRDL